MSAGYAACSCQEAEALKARVAELESLLEAAAAELDRCDTHLGALRRCLHELHACINANRIGMAIYKINAALKETP